MALLLTAAPHMLTGGGRGISCGNQQQALHQKTPAYCILRSARLHDLGGGGGGGLIVEM